MPKYTVLDKDTIKTEIMPYLSVAKRGYVSQASLIEVVNAILHKLKSGCQWHQLPVGHLFGEVVLSWNAVYHHSGNGADLVNGKQCSHPLSGNTDICLTCP